jgi:dGTPase
VVAADHGYVFHNRLTHTLKVAQIGRRLAEKINLDKRRAALAEKLGGLDPDVVEAAGLAHDLGHPPFGHLAETVLDDLVVKAGVAGGYEGNAQSFRIVTKLAVRTEDQAGLNLTRATLNAILKYPWLRHTDGEMHRKWGAYDSEIEDFHWAREPFQPHDPRKTLEAEIMDYADDIAYSIYDLEDFFKAGKIPLEQMSHGGAGKKEPPAIKAFLLATFSRWNREGKSPAGTDAECHAATLAVAEFFPNWHFSDTRSQRGFLRDMTSILVGRYIDGIGLKEPKNKTDRRVEISQPLQREMRMLQELTWHYVINNPNLATQQHGYKIVIKGLFDSLLAAINDENWAVFPPGMSELITDNDTTGQNVRTVADFIASMSEPQAVELYQRLMGISMGSFLKNVV